MGTWFSRESETERLLRTARPRPTDELVGRLAHRAASPARRRVRPRGRLALAGVVTAVMVAAVASVGGLGYAASTVSQAVSQVTSKATYMGHEMAFLSQAHQASHSVASAARAQYGGTTTATTTTTVTSASGSSATVTTQTIAPTSGKGSTTITLQAGASVTISTAAFKEAVKVAIKQVTGSDVSDPLVQAVVDNIVKTVTKSAKGDAGAGADAASQITFSFVSFSITSTSSGGEVTSLGQDPADITIGTLTAFRASAIKATGNPALTPIPVVTEDGVAIRALKNVGGPTGDLGATGDGYYIASDGTLHVLTLHPGAFGLISKLAVNVGETGRALQAPGSGKFGDPTLMTFGKPALRRVGTVSVQSLGSRGAIVPATFFVSEQASVHLAIFQGSHQIGIVKAGSSIRGRRMHGGLVKSLHVAILRPGTITTQLHVLAGRLMPGQAYRLRVTAVDPDGNKTVAYIPFTG